MSTLRVNIKYCLYSLILVGICIILYRPLVPVQKRISVFVPQKSELPAADHQKTTEDILVQKTEKKSQSIGTINHVFTPGDPNDILIHNTIDTLTAYHKELADINPEGHFTSSNISSGLQDRHYNNIFNPDIRIKGAAEDIRDIAFTGVSDALSLVTNPVRWDTHDLLDFAIVTAGTLILYSADEQIHKSVANTGSPSQNDIVKFGEFYGNTSTTEFASLGITAYGLIVNDRDALKLGLEIYESYFIAEKITGLLKYSLGRSRPSDNAGAYVFRMFDRPKNACALPSGHSTLAFSLSTVLASYTDNTYIKILIYSPAFLTAYSRIRENHHWASDVFLGAAIGHFVGSYITSRHNGSAKNAIELGMDADGRPSLRVNF